MRYQVKLRGFAIFLLYKILSATWRIHYEEDPDFQEMLSRRSPVILAHWHGDELALLHTVKRYRLATLTSQSRDGELMNDVLQRLGVATARGSSSRGGATGLRHLIKLCRHHRRNVSFAVDGPRGPLNEVKPGVFEFSRLMQLPIYAATASAEQSWVFHKAWNRAFLPKPFVKVTVKIKKGLRPISRDADPRNPQIADTVKTLLNS
jgi:lysophospholipid acyltransferase (LPLAT)-like uncharacterized protein